jgi:signal transduction histidine kinase
VTVGTTRVAQGRTPDSTAARPMAGAVLPWMCAALVACLSACGLVLATLNRVGLGEALGEFYVATTACGLSFGVLGFLVTRTRPASPAGWLYCAVALTTALPGFVAQYARYGLVTHPSSVPAGRLAAWLADCAWPVGYGLLLVGVPLLFPDGRPLSRRWRIAGWVGAVAVALSVVGNALLPAANPDLPEVPNPYGVPRLAGLAGVLTGIGTLLLLLALVAAVWSLVLRYRRGGTRPRYQVRWLALAAVTVAVGAIGVQAGAMLLHATRNPVLLAYVEAGVGPLLAAGIGVAVLRHRLYDIDIWINRTLVWGTMTALVVSGYVLVVGWLGAKLDVHGTGWGLVAAAAVAVAFHPARERVQRAVNRVLYGWRQEPYTALTELGRRLETAVSPDALLSTIVTTVAEALRLPYVSITVGGGAPVESGAPRPTAVRLPLQVGTDTVGELAVAARHPGEPLAAADHRLLADFARQAAVATHAARLTTDLQVARQRLVTAREEERRRLRRDLHDGLGPLLASQSLTADAARGLLHTNPAAAEPLLVDLRTQAQQAVTDIRRIAHDLRPPALDDRGLLVALRDNADRFSGAELRVSVSATGPLPDLPAAVEVAAYRIANEAMTNAVRHAHAGTCTVVLSAHDGFLRLDVADDGHGLPTDVSAGVGLASIRERAAELGGTCEITSPPGGGVRVTATLPIRDTP